jgi:hypothetical protein
MPQTRQRVTFLEAPMGGWIIFAILMGVIAINIIDMGRKKGRHE